MLKNIFKRFTANNLRYLHSEFFAFMFTKQAMLIIATILSIMIVFLSGFYAQNMKRALDMVDSKNKEVGKNIVNNVSTALQNISLHLAVLANSNHDEDVLKSKEISSRIMWEQLRGDPNIASVFMGDRSGNFLQARRTPALAIREIQARDKQSSDFWAFKDDNYKTIESKTTIADYDCRTRVWYKNASQNGKFYWTDPYIFASTGALGITVAIPTINNLNEKIKVVAADFTLETIAKLLKEQSKIIDGDIVLFSANKDIISASFAYEANTTDGKLATVEQLKTSKVPNAYSKIINGELNGEVMEKESGEKFIYSTSIFPTFFGKNWYIVAFVSKDKATVDARDSLYIAIMEMIGILTIMTAGTIFWVAKNKKVQKELANRSLLMDTLLNSIPNPIFYKDENGAFTGFNKAYENSFGVDSRTLIGKTVMELDYLALPDREAYNIEDMKTISETLTIVREQDMLFADNEIHHTIYSVNGFKDSDDKPCGLIGIFADITEQKKTNQALKNMMTEVEELHKHTRESIEYASLIQHSLVPNNSLFRNYFQDYFVIWHPKDIVGGDIYFFEELNSGEDCLLLIVDCTGHGVPGAFVTMLVKAVERQVITNIKSSKEPINPAKLLGVFNKSMKSLLKQDDVNSISNAGFDGAILYYNKKDKIVKFAGAQTPLFYVKDGKLEMIKGNRHSIGYKKSDASFEFTEHIIEVKESMCFYLSTDGYLDQNGGEKGFPFGKKKFSSLIEEYYEETFADQQEIFLDSLHSYQGGEVRNDDVTLIGFRI